MFISWFRLTCGLACAAALIGGSLSATAQADDAAAPPKKAAQIKPKGAADASKGASPADGDAEKDPYKVPEKADVKELLDFIKEIISIRPTSAAQMEQHRPKAMQAIRAAGEKIQKIATPEDKKLEGYDEVAGMLLSLRAAEAPTLSPEDLKKLTEDVKSSWAAADSGPEQARVAQAAIQLAVGLEATKPEQAIEAYKEIGPLIAQSKNPPIATQGKKMEGAARRLGLIGNQMEINGVELNGDKFDWAKYRGKVVLVDFWATWCGPCIAELPNVKKNYEQYHDKGFDVVGISLDQDRGALEEFVKKEANPWVTMQDGAGDGKSVADYYGVMFIPTVILVDKEGKVVSTAARGPELGRLLAKLLGPADGEKADDDKADAPKKKETKEKSAK